LGKVSNKDVPQSGSEGERLSKLSGTRKYNNDTQATPFRELKTGVYLQYGVWNLMYNQASITHCPPLPKPVRAGSVTRD